MSKSSKVIVLILITLVAIVSVIGTSISSISSFEFGTCDANCTANSTGVSLNTGENSSIFDSGILDATSQVYWGSINWTFTNSSENDNVTIQVRRGNYAKPDITDDDFAAYWTLNTTSIDGGNYTEYFEVSNGSIVGNPTNVSGVFEGENATEFDGVDDYLNAGNDTSLDIREAITISAWVKLTSYDNFGVIAHKGTSYWFGFRSTTGELRMDINNGTAWSNLVIDSSDALALDTWYHVAMVYNSTAMILYVDGEEKKKQARTGLINKTIDDLYIGRATDNAFYLNGAISHLAIFNRTLSESELLNWTSYTGESLESQGLEINTTDIDTWRFLQYRARLRTNDTINALPILSRVDATYADGATTFKLDETTGASLEDSGGDIVFVPQVWFTEATKTRKQIASNLSGDQNIEVSFKVNSCQLAPNYDDREYVDEMWYTNDGGTRQQLTLDTSKCSNNIYVDTFTIAPAVSSNLIEINYRVSDSGANTGGGGGGSQATDLPITAVCGNLVCEEGEDSFSCVEDCSIGILKSLASTGENKFEDAVRTLDLSDATKEKIINKIPTIVKLFYGAFVIMIISTIVFRNKRGGK